MANMLLDSVNVLLATINELPLESEEDLDNVLEARQAVMTLEEVKRAVLGEGWDFNTDDNWEFPTNEVDEIPVPENVLDITANNADVIMRDWKLYSRSNMSYEFDEPVVCKVVWDFDFDAISHPIRNYITIRSARIFAQRTIGDSGQVQFTAIDEEDALISARRSESRTGQYNMLSSGSYGQNYNARPQG